jgi:AraC-like DNA-binding protein
MTAYRHGPPEDPVARSATPTDRRSYKLLPSREPHRGRHELGWRAPHPRLAPFVTHHYTAAWWSPPKEMRTARVLFDAGIKVVSDLDRITVRGVRRTTRHVREEKFEGMLLGTSLRPGAFRVFSDRAAATINDVYAPLSTLLGASGKVLAAELVDVSESEDDYYDALESILLGRAPAVDAGYALVQSADRAMSAGDPRTSIKDIADQESVSLRTLQRTFNKYVGVSPKWVMRRYRMLATVSRIAEGRYEDFASLSLELGYSDQAHLARDFRDETGFSPTGYIQTIGSVA